MAAAIVVEVRLWGGIVGAVASLEGKPGYFEFQYAPEFAARGLEPSPLVMPVGAGRRYSFTELDRRTYYGLPGLLADSCPTASATPSSTSTSRAAARPRARSTFCNGSCTSANARWAPSSSSQR